MLSTKLDQLIRDGYVMVRKHPTQPLHILNYTAKTQIERAWCKDTIACRGLIINQYGKVVSRPFKKFFNVGELSYFSDRMDDLYGIQYGEIFSQEFSVYEKKDGCLGVSYIDGKGRHCISSRGSFDSEQSDTANAIFKKKYSDFEFNKNKTYLFEIVSPKHRIVVDYGGIEDLFLLAIIDTKTGKDLEVPNNLPFPRPKKFDNVYGFESLVDTGGNNEEGYVLVASNGFRAKYKFLQYISLHRVMTGVTPRRIYELIRNGIDLRLAMENVPDEFYNECKEIANKFTNRYSEVEQEANQLYHSLDKEWTRKQIAQTISKSPVSSIVFNMLDSKDYSEKIWRMVEKELC